MKFEKVSYEQFADKYQRPDVEEVYNDIKLPKRATAGSAGYDFYAPYDINLNSSRTLLIPTGIRVLLDKDKFLGIYPRSGLGFKYRLRLDNTVGIVDADYSSSDNEGHIMAKITNEGYKEVTIKKGEAFMQGIIQQYFLVEDDDADGVRNGGFGSTTSVEKTQPRTELPILYTTHCPMCESLTRMLAKNGIQYSVVEDEDEIIRSGATSVPSLKVDGKMLTFNEAVKWIKTQQK